jgi:hypothetical protein
MAQSTTRAFLPFSHKDAVFANPTMNGEPPYWPRNLMKRYINRVTRANGMYTNIAKRMRKHTVDAGDRRCLGRMAMVLGVPGYWPELGDALDRAVAEDRGHSRGRFWHRDL